MTEPGIALRLLADLMRVGAAVSALAALVGIPSIGLGTRFLLVLLVMMIPRAVGGVAAPLDLAFGATLLAAVWTSTADWYGAPVAWFVHAAAAGVTAAVLYLVLARTGLLYRQADPSAIYRARVVGHTAAIGLVVGGVWEAYRWLEPALAARSTQDLVVRLLGDLAGAVIAGLVLSVARRPDDDDGADGAPGRMSADDRLGSIF